jgi:hypothetical protein
VKHTRFRKEDHLPDWARRTTRLQRVIVYAIYIKSQLVNSCDWYVGTNIPKDLPASVCRIVQAAWNVELMSPGMWCRVDWYVGTNVTEDDCHEDGESTPPRKSVGIYLIINKAHHPRIHETEQHCRSWKCSAFHAMRESRMLNDNGLCFYGTARIVKSEYDSCSDDYVLWWWW